MNNKSLAGVSLLLRFRASFEVGEVTSPWRFFFYSPFFCSHVCFPKLPNLFRFTLQLNVFTWHCGSSMCVILVHLELFPEVETTILRTLIFHPPTAKLFVVTLYRCGPGSSVGIEAGYGLDGPAIEYRWRARFSASVQTCPGAHPASCTIDTGSFPGVKNGRGVTLTPHPF